METIRKLELFIYDHSGIPYNDLNKVLSYATVSKKDIDIEGNYIFNLRKKLNYINKISDNEMPLSELDELVNNFIILMRTRNIEASLAIDSLMDAVWDRENTECVKRLTGILSCIFMLYYINQAGFFDESQTKLNMCEIICRYSAKYSDEDIKFIENILWREGKFDVLIEFLKSMLRVEDETEKYTDDSIRKVTDDFFSLLMRLKNARKFNELLIFHEKSERIFKFVDDQTIKLRWYSEKSDIYFRLGEYRKAKEIYEEYQGRFNASEDVYTLYNGAIYNAWAANFTEHGGEEWTNCLREAENNIDNVLELLRDDNEHPIYRYAMLEKAYLLSENDRHKDAFFCIENVLHSIDWENIPEKGYFFPDMETKDEWPSRAIEQYNFGTYLWIIMQYIRVQSEDSQEQKRAISLLKKLYDKYRGLFKSEYHSLLDLIFNENEFHNQSQIPEDGMAVAILRLLLSVLEIWYDAEVGDISKYTFLYYTTNNSLRFLMNDDKEEINYRLPLFNVRHMNDPREGRMIFELLENKGRIVKRPSGLNDRTKYENINVFLKSFLGIDRNKQGVVERLPMWVQYADEGKGCCIVLNNKTFKGIRLRKIFYISNNGKCSNEPEMDDMINELIDAYVELLKIVKTSTGHFRTDAYLREIDQVVQYWVSKIAYLFKHDSYEHENEYRLIENISEDNINEIKEIKGEVPKAFIYSHTKSYVNEVILGPKSTSPDDYVPFIYTQGHKMWGKESGKEIMVTHSALSFR